MATTITGKFNITTVPTTVTWQNLTGMTSINWGDGTVDTNLSHEYTTAGEYSFSIDDVTEIGQEAIRDCTALVAINISGDVKSIGKNAFFGCTNLTDLTLNEGLEYIGNQAISYCNALTGNIVIPDSVTSLGVGAVDYNSNITGIIINETSSLTSLPTSFYSGCTSIESIVMPDCITSIGQNIFAQCYALKSVKLSENIREIPVWTFQDCTSIETITLPSNISEIQWMAFEHTNSLKTLILESTTPPSLSTPGFTSALSKIVVPYSEDHSVLAAYQAASGWSSYASIIKEVMTITYELNGGTVSTANPTSYSEDDLPITLNNPTKTDYKFMGWTGSGLNKRTKNVTIPVGTTGALSFTANFEYKVSVTEVGNETLGRPIHDLRVDDLIVDVDGKLDKASSTTDTKEYFYTHAGTNQYTDRALINDLSTEGSATDTDIATGKATQTELFKKLEKKKGDNFPTAESGTVNTIYLCSETSTDESLIVGHTYQCQLDSTTSTYSWIAISGGEFEYEKIDDDGALRLILK